MVLTPGPALFGGSWLSKLQLDWGEIKALKLSQTLKGVAAAVRDCTRVKAHLKATRLI